MKTYHITITETLEMTVPIQAENPAKAEKIAEKNWQDSQYILDAEHFAGVSFKVRNLEKRGKMNGKEEKNTREAAKGRREIIDKRGIIIAANGGEAFVFGG